MTNQLPSEKVVISAPFSFTGSAQRIWKITSVDNQLAKWLLFTPLALVLIMSALVFVLFWYFVMYILFGILFIPYRLLRRGSRKRRQERLRHREVLDAIERKARV